MHSGELLKPKVCKKSAKPLEVLQVFSDLGSMTGSSMSDFGDLAACQKKRQYRNQNKYDSGLITVHNFLELSWSKLGCQPAITICLRRLSHDFSVRIRQDSEGFKGWRELRPASKRR